MVSLLGPLEALLFAAGSEGIATDELARLLDVPVAEVRSLCAQLKQTYEDRGSGIDLVELAGAWQLVTRPEHAPYLRRLATAPSNPGLSQAALEVLAIVAYRQPISRAQVEEVRGVQSDSVLQTLLHRQLVCEVGRMEAPGRPILYGTTPLFLQVFGLRSLEDLPPLPEVDVSEDDLSLFHIAPSVPRD
ncbi:MAG: SMC-Scp complex subunit ScpB [Alicyclobacillus sp.]|nr:SMC-Scp complex subunit ScpB [Alicyclobacillus sp.]